MLDTPAVIVSEKKLQGNISRMQSIADNHGVKLRPHTKTHKIPAFARRQLDGGASGITVAKVSEAEVMADSGLADIFIAYPLVSEMKIERLLQLQRRMRVIVGVDSVEGARRLSTLAERHGLDVEFRLEVDTGLGRTGIPYDDALAIANEIAHLPCLKMQGIYTYRGSFMNGQSTLDRRSAGREEGQRMAELAHRIREQGIAIDDVSVGSTPTAEFAAEVDGVTEIRPGTYVFYDRMQMQLGCCTENDCAAHVAVTIVSMPSADRLIVDGGSKTFATDVQPNTPPLDLAGFGHVSGYPGLVLERMTEEHGVIFVKQRHDLTIGDTLRIIPNHICSTINLHNHIYLHTQTGAYTKVDVSARGKLH